MIGRGAVLAQRQPAMLLLDEIAAGLDDREIAELSSVIRAVRDHGETVILVEHNFALVKELADLVVVLSGGKVVVVDEPKAVAGEHPEVLEHYLGQRKVHTTETSAKRA